MTTAFYLGSKGTLQDKVICLRTGSKYSHCELIFKPDFYLVNHMLGAQIQGTRTKDSALCFSSSNRDGGTRFKWIEFKPDRWDFVDFSEKSVLRVEDGALGLLGHTYGWKTIARYVLPFGEHSKTGLICSEAIVLCLQNDGSMDHKVKPWTVSPGKLYKMLKETK